MGPHKALTNETLNDKFQSSFELVTYAIKLAHDLIISGRPPRVHIGTENPAQIVLAEIDAGVDFIAEPEEEDDDFEAIEEAKKAMAQKGIELVKASLDKKK